MVSLRSRAALPGVLLALPLTAGALFALVLAIGIRGDGPLSLLIGGADGAARLQDREAVAPLGDTSSGPVFGPVEASSAGTPATGGVPTARRSPARRGGPRAGVPGRRSPTQAPSRPAPVRPAPTAPPAPPASSAPKPPGPVTRPAWSAASSSAG